MQFEVVRFLVGSEAGKEMQRILDKRGQTFLDAATPKHHCEIVRVLVVSCHENFVGLSSLFVVAGHFP